VCRSGSAVSISVVYLPTPWGLLRLLDRLALARFSSVDFAYGGSSSGT